MDGTITMRAGSPLIGLARPSAGAMEIYHGRRGSVRCTRPHTGSCPTPLLACLVSPYFLLLEADLVGFLAGFALALAIAMPPSFSYAPGSSAKV